MGYFCENSKIFMGMMIQSFLTFVDICQFFMDTGYFSNYSTLKETKSATMNIFRKNLFSY